MIQANDLCQPSVAWPDLPVTPRANLTLPEMRGGKKSCTSFQWNPLFLYRQLEGQGEFYYPWDPLWVKLIGTFQKGGRGPQSITFRISRPINIYSKLHCFFYNRMMKAHLARRPNRTETKPMEPVHRKTVNPKYRHLPTKKKLKKKETSWPRSKIGHRTLKRIFSKSIWFKCPWIFTRSGNFARL